MNLGYIFLAIVLILTIVLRLLELLIAKKNRNLRIQNPQTHETKERYFVFFVLLHSMFLISVPLEVILFKRDFSNYGGMIFGGIYLFCLILRFHVLKILNTSWNTKIITDTSPDSIVTKGVYRFIRHPNYLVVILEILSISLIHNAYLTFIFFSVGNAILLAFRIPLEESKLFQNHKYQEHFADKKRFLPGIF